MNLKICSFLLTLLAFESAFSAANGQQSNIANDASNASLERRLDGVERSVSEKLDANEKLIQARIDQVTAISSSLEISRKSIDWWLSLIGVVFTGGGLLLAAVPYFVIRGQRKDFEQEFAQAKSYLGEIENMRNKADSALKEIVRSDDPKSEKAAAQDKLAKQAKTSPLALLAERAMALEKEGDWEGAAIRWESITDAQSDNPRAWFNLGYALSQAAKADSETSIKSLETAIHAYRKVLELQPDHEAALSNLGFALSNLAQKLPEQFAKDRFVEANAIFSKICEKSPSDQGAWKRWGLHLGAQARKLDTREQHSLYEAAEQKFSVAHNLNPSDPDTLYSWGLVLGDQSTQVDGEERLKKLAAAEEKFLHAAGLNPDDFNSWYMLAITSSSICQNISGSERIEKQSEIENAFNNALRIRQDSLEAILGLARFFGGEAAICKGLSDLQRINYYEKAIALLDRALIQAPRNVDALRLKGAGVAGLIPLYPEEKARSLLPELNNVYNKYVELDPNPPAARKIFASALVTVSMTLPVGSDDRCNLIGLALDQFSEASKINPNDDSIWFLWGSLLTRLAKDAPIKDKGKAYEEAIDKLERSIRIATDNKKAWAMQAQALFEYWRHVPGQVDLLYRAETALKNSIGQDGIDSSTYNLACIAALSGKSDEARDWLAMAVSSRNPPKLSLLETDTDLDSLRHFDWFKSMLNGVRSTLSSTI